jgi:hypothetical protein
MEKSNDHPNPRSAPMWNLTSHDIHRIRGQLQARRARIDAKYAEDTKALDGDVADLETLERVAASVALKYNTANWAETSEENWRKAEEDGAPVEAEAAPEEQPAATSAHVGDGPDLKAASRWRLTLQERLSVSAPE